MWDLLLGEGHFEALSVHPADVSDAALAAPGVLVSAMALHAQLELATWLRRPHHGDNLFRSAGGLHRRPRDRIARRRASL